MNCQLVLCPGYNDGQELEKSLNDLLEYENVECIACVPVGLSNHREGLAKLAPFNETTAGETIDIIEKSGDTSLEKYGERRCYAADEFYLLGKRKMPEADYYGDFLQLENGVGMWALLKKEACDALEDLYCASLNKTVTLVTGVAAYPLIKDIALKCEEKVKGLKCNVFGIVNHYFGERITVAGLVTATDIYDQLQNKDLGEEILIPSSMLRSEGDMFLDSITVDELSEKLNIGIKVTECDGYSLIESIVG